MKGTIIKIIIGQSNKNYLISHTQGPESPLPRDVMPLAPENSPYRIPLGAPELEPALLCYLSRKGCQNIIIIRVRSRRIYRSCFDT